MSLGHVKPAVARANGQRVPVLRGWDRGPSNCVICSHQVSLYFVDLAVLVGHCCSCGTV